MGFRLVLMGGSLAAVLALVAPLDAEEHKLRMAADAVLQQSGLLKYLLPRFSLKTGIGIEVVVASPNELERFVASGDAGVVIAKQALPALVAPSNGQANAAFRSIDVGGASGSVFSVLTTGSGRDGAAEKFVDWLMSDIGQGTVAAFKVDGAALYLPGAAEAEIEIPDMPVANADRGEALALLHCGRCHVVNHRNRMGGIGSTPSFAAIRTIRGWQDRFLTFWALNPHPSFTQVEGLTDPFDPNRPPHIAPVEITKEELDAILAFTATIPPKDLGVAIQSR